jgi:hypothetical protein
MEFSGSLSGFGYGKVDTLMDDVVRVFSEAKSSVRKRKLSELAGLVMDPGADETEFRAKCTKFAVLGSAELGEFAPGERAVDDLLCRGLPSSVNNVLVGQQLMSLHVMEQKVLTSFLSCCNSFLNIGLRSLKRHIRIAGYEGPRKPLMRQNRT